MRKLQMGYGGGPVPPGGRWGHEERQSKFQTQELCLGLTLLPVCLRTRKGPETGGPFPLSFIIFSFIFTLGFWACGCWFILVSPMNPKTVQQGLPRAPAQFLYGFLIPLFLLQSRSPLLSQMASSVLILISAYCIIQEKDGFFSASFSLNQVKMPWQFLKQSLC